MSDWDQFVSADSGDIPIDDATEWTPPPIPTGVGTGTPLKGQGDPKDNPFYQAATGDWGRGEQPSGGAQGFAPSFAGKIDYSAAAPKYANAFQDVGFSGNVIAGLMGNGFAESGFDPHAKGDGGAARGVFQWHPDRAAEFQKMMGIDVSQATPMQVALFTKYEIDRLPAAKRAAILNAPTPAAAAVAIDQHFERSKGLARGKRMAAANAWAAAHGGKVDDDWSQFAPAKDAPKSSSDPWAQFAPAAAAPAKPKGWWGTLGDYGTELGSALYQAGAGASQVVGTVIDSLTGTPALSEGYTLLAENLKNKAKETALKNPTLGQEIMHGAIGSVPLLINPIIGAKVAAGDSYDAHYEAAIQAQMQAPNEQAYWDTFHKGKNQGMSDEAALAFATKVAEAAPKRQPSAKEIEKAQIIASEGAVVSGAAMLIPGEKIVGGIIGKSLGKAGMQIAEKGLARVGVNAASRIGGNAAIGGAMTLGDNAVAQQYDPNRPLFHDVGKQALIMAAGGELLHGGIALGKKATSMAADAIRKRAAKPDPLNETNAGEPDFANMKQAKKPSKPAKTPFEMPPTDAIEKYRDDNRPVASEALQVRAAEAGVDHAPDAPHDTLLADVIEQEADTGAPSHAATNEHEAQAEQLLSPNDIVALNGHLEVLSGGKQSEGSSAGKVSDERDVRSGAQDAAGERVANPEGRGAGAREAAAAASPELNAAKLERTASGKGVTLTGATPEQIAAIKDALPDNAKVSPGKDGALLYSAKHEDLIRDVLNKPATPPPAGAADVVAHTEQPALAPHEQAELAALKDINATGQLHDDADVERMMDLAAKEKAAPVAAGAAEAAQPAIDYDALARRRAELLGRDVLPSDHKFVDYIRNKDFWALRDMLRPDNKKSRLIFTEATGIKLPSGLATTREVLREWAGITKDEVAKAAADHEAEIERGIAERNRKFAISTAENMRVRDSSGNEMSAREWIDARINDGFDRLVNNSRGPVPKWNLANDLGQGFPVKKELLDYARIALEGINPRQATDEQMAAHEGISPDDVRASNYLFLKNADRPERAKADGAEAFARGEERRLPSYLHDMGSAVGEAWYRGWDQANLAKPLPDAAKPTPEAAATSKAKPIGKNLEGHDVFEDANGVRSYSRNGIRHEETVSLVPTRDQGYVASVDTSKRSDQFLTAEEAAARKPTWGSQNKGVSIDRAAEVRRLLKERMNRLNAGIDPETLLLGSELAAFHIEAGARKFADFARAMIGDLGESFEKLRPFLRHWYDGARHELVDRGLPTADMDSPEVMAAALKDFAQEAEQAHNVPKETDNAGDAIYPPSTGPLETMVSENVPEPQANGGTEPTGAIGQPDSSEPSSANDATGIVEGGRGGVRSSATDKPATGARGGRKNQPRVKGEPVAETPGEEVIAANKVIENSTPINVPASDFTISDDVKLGEGTEGVKFQDNLDAIKTLKRLETENRRASPEEQRQLARYVGWGGLKNAFRVAGAKEGEGVAKGWEKRVSEIEELLTPDELKAARNSTTAAHYTSKTVVDAMWKAAQKLGFREGAILEPSMGTGNFLGLMPENLRGGSRTFGVEYDGLTARIAKKLYPNADVVHSGFQQLPLPKNQFALAIGNPPFGRESLYFPHNSALNGKSIHNQFFLGSLDALAPGGTMAMVVSHNLMDALDPSARKEMARRGRFIGGIRLPDTAFKENARTSVVTDMLFFKKLTEDEQAVADASIKVMEGGEYPKGHGQPAPYEIDRALQTMNEWVPSSTIDDPAGSGERINANPFFVSRPYMVVGDINATGTMNARADLNVTLADPSQFESLLDQAVSRLPEIAPVNGIAKKTLRHYQVMADAMRLSAMRAEPGAIAIDLDNKLNMVVDFDAGEMGKALMREIPLTENTPFPADYNYTIDGKWQRATNTLGEDGKPLKVVKEGGKVTNRNQKELVTYQNENEIPPKDRWGKDRVAIVRDLLPVRDAIKNQIVLESSGATDAQIAAGRNLLNAKYDAFVAKHGALNDRKIANLADVMPDGGLPLATEKYVDGKWVKSDIMSRRVTTPPKFAEHAENANDAISIALSESGRIDIERIAKLLGTDVPGAERALSEGETPRAFYDPETKRWEPRDLYLSGLVKRKLNMARAAGLDANAKALESIIPEDLTPDRITPILGSNWIPPDVYADFLKHLGYHNAHVSYSELTNAFTVYTDGKPAAEWETSANAHNADAIVDKILNSKGLKVTFKDENKKTHVDEVGTAESEQKGEELASEFQDWAFNNDERRDRLVNIFNEKFNSRLLRQRDGSHLQLFGKVPDAVIKMRRHQMNGIWRGITDPAVLYDHVVGAGKTFTAIARIMERRRMGMSNKPLVVVPNHLVEQWAKDAIKLYPGAKIMAAGKADFERANRRRLFARIAASDFDMAIIGHSSFNFIDLDRATEERYIQDELQSAHAAVIEAEKAAAEAGQSGFRKPFGVAEAERLVKKLEERLARLRGGNRDRLLSFEQMGIDDLTIDEAHEFKNLAYSSRLQDIRGMGNKTGSQKAMDLHLKMRAIRERHNTSIAFLTGTPISNSVSEMYLLMRNLVPQELKEMGLENFDAWRSMFVSAGTEWEPTEAGGVKEVNRLGRNWANMRPLMDLWYSVADAVTNDDIKAAYAEDNPGKKYPLPDTNSQRANGRDREVAVVPPSPTTQRILEEVVRGFEELPFEKDPKARNIARLKLMDRARKVSLDPRAVDPTIDVGDERSKLATIADRVAATYKKWNSDKGTQIIFLDRSVPKSKGDDKIIAAYDAAYGKLMDAVSKGDEDAKAKALDGLEKFNPNEIEAMRVAQAGGWNAYDELKKLLKAQGIPESEVAYVQEANTDKQKSDLFGKVNRGEVRVLIGSTQRMGAGTNVQERLVALHHGDTTWKPSDIEQREGRIVRQGNSLLAKYGDDKFAVDVIAYVTERSIDAKMWDLNAKKLKAINGIRKYDGADTMEFDDAESVGMAEMAALATGNPLMIQRVELDGDIKKMQLQQRSYNNRINALRSKIASNVRQMANGPQRADMYAQFADVLEAQKARVQANSTQRMAMVDGKPYNDVRAATDAAQAIIAKFRANDPKARFSIDIDGEKITSVDGVDNAIRNKLGTPDFEGSLGDQQFIDTNDLAKAIGAKAVESKGKKEFTISGVSIDGMPAEIDVGESFGKVSASISVLDAQGREVAQYNTLTDAFTPSTARALINKIREQMDPIRFRSAAAYEQRKVEAAAQEQEGLQAEVAKPWPKTDELAAKREQLQQVITELSGEKRSDETQAEGDAKQSIAEPGSEQLSASHADMLDRLREVGLEGKVALKIVKSLGGPAGEFHRNVITIAMDGPSAMHALNHEVVHAMRGAFTDAEWRALSRVATGDARLMASIKKRYFELSGEDQVEEAVSDLFARFATGERQPAGLLLKAWERIKAIFEAIGNALRGNGFRTAKDVMRAMSSGEIASRMNDMTEAGALDASFARQSRVERDDKEAPRTGPGGIITNILGRGVDNVGHKLAEAARKALPDPVQTALHEVRMGLDPIAEGSDRAQGVAKDFANAKRLAAYQWGKLDEWLVKNFDAESRRRMWEAADEQGVILRRGDQPGPNEGLNRLTDKERDTVLELQRRADASFKAAQDLGMVTGEGLESYVPRMIIEMTASGPKVISKTTSKQERRGGKISTTTGQLRQRKYETVEETEAAARAAFGNGVEVVRDIRTLGVATQRLDQAIAGRTLVENIKTMSKDTGDVLVEEGSTSNPQSFFTMPDEPALQTWGVKFVEDAETGKVVPALDQNGDMMPLWISKEFEGPLKAVLTGPSSGIVRAIMDIKAKQMSIIMYNPVMHNAVIWGKAIPADPLGVLLLYRYFAGNKVRNDPAQMSQAIKDGMDPIGGRYFNQDIAGIASAEGQGIKAGQSWTSQILGKGVDLFSPTAGEATRRAIDKFGDVWHNTLLWDRIADLQAGLYAHLREKGIKAGLDPVTAGREAAHFANRYAGALPMEAMSQMARTTANLLLFSRSFTLGNMAAAKDVIGGLPSDVKAQILRDAGPLMLDKAQGRTRLKAASMLLIESAFSTVSLVLAAHLAAWLAGQIYQAPSDNEKGKEGRFLIRYDENGTAIYGRLPTGKVNEDQIGWVTQPRDIMLRKLSFLGKLMYEVAANDRGFGHKIIGPDDKGIYGYGAVIGRLGYDVIIGTLPMSQYDAVNDYFHGTGDKKSAALAAMLPLAGITISPGAPGGPGMADIYNAKESQRFRFDEAKAEIGKMIKRGDVAGARQKMNELKVAPSLQSYIIRTTLNPSFRMNGKQVRDFMRIATPEQVEKFRADQAAMAKRKAQQ